MKHIAVGLAICLSLALLLVWVSANFHDRFQNRNRDIQQQLAYLRGDVEWFRGKDLRYVPEFQNRILFPSLLQTVSRVKVLSVADWYLLLRLATAALALSVFWHLLIRHAGASIKLAAIGCGALAYAVLFTFNMPTEQPSDFLDMLFVSLFIWSTLARSKLGLGAAALVACANRESAVFAGVVWIAVWGLDERRRIRWAEIGFGAGLAALCYALVVLIRYSLGGPQAITRQMLGAASLWERLSRVVADPNPFAWPFLLGAMLLPIGWWLASNRHTIDARSRRLMAATLVITVVTLLFGIVEELRIFLPTIVLLVFIAVRAEANADASMFQIEPLSQR